VFQPTGLQKLAPLKGCSGTFMRDSTSIDAIMFDSFLENDLNKYFILKNVRKKLKISQ